MITFDQAQQVARQTIGSDVAFCEELTVEKPYGWHFTLQSKRFLQTGDPEEMGGGSIFVEKDTGHVLHISSSWDLEDWFAHYEAGLCFSCYDLTIRRVYDLAKTLEMLTALDMMYIVPEEENGTVWKPPRFYTKEQIGTALSEMPCTFSRTWFRALHHSALETFQAMDASGCCVYERRGRSDDPLNAA